MTKEPDPKTENAQPRERRSAAYILVSLFLALAVGLCLIVSVQVSTRGYVDLFGYSVFRVVTGSMLPTIDVGEAILSQKTPAEELRVGDIVCYTSEVSEIRGSIVTHRIVRINQSPDGTFLLETRGDANLSSDPFLVSADQVIGRVIWTSGSENFFTELLSFATGKLGFLALVVLPVIFAAGLIMSSSVKRLGRELRQMRAELAHPDPLDEPLPGFTTLTRRDYEELYAALLEALLKELNDETTVDKGRTQAGGSE